MSKVLRPTLASLVLSLASSLLPCAAMTNTLVYVAEFGKIGDDGSVQTIRQTTNVTMTVSLYGSNLANRRALWCRRLEVPVWDGQFAVELDDGLGVVDETKNPQHATLAEVFAAAEKDAAWWVGVSGVRLADTDERPAWLDDTEKMGRLAAVPFAVEAEWAEAALGDFRVDGTATVQDLAVAGDLTATQCATFHGDVTFRSNVVFSAADGLSVTGTLARTSLDTTGAGTVIRTKNLYATTSIAAGSLAVAADATLTPDGANAALTTPTDLSVAGTLAARDGVTATSATAAALEVSGALTLGGSVGGRIDWKKIGDQEPGLSAPEGVYTAAAATTDYHNEGVSPKAISAASEKERLGTFVVSTGSGQTATLTNGTSQAQALWCHACAHTDSDAGVTLTVLCPLGDGSGDSVAVSGGRVLSYTIKELSK